MIFKKITLLIFVLITQLLIAQEEDAWVFFKDKENVQGSIENPISILTQEAIDRKSSHNTPIDERDVPVNESYVSAVKNTTGITVLAKSKWFNCVFVRGTEAMIRTLGSLDFVDRLDFADNSLDTGIRKNKIEHVYRPTKRKSEFLSKVDFDYGEGADQIKQINGDYLHQQDFTGEGMIIAVMDNGFPSVDTSVAYEKLRSEGKLLGGYNFVGRSDDVFQLDSHGALALSIMAGYKKGEFIGTAPDASYYLFITEDDTSEGPKEEALWVEAAERADSLGVDVINTSFGYARGFDNPAYEYTPADMDGQTAFISRGANIAFDKGMLVVTSIYFSNGEDEDIVGAPADAPSVLTVGSVDANGDFSSFGSVGPTADNRVKPDIAARGEETVAINVDATSTIALVSGISISPPLVSGAAACLWQAFPEKTNAEVMQMIRESASQFDNPTDQSGYGIPDFKNVLQVLETEDIVIAGYKLFPNPVQELLHIDIPGQQDITASVFSIEGKKIMTKVMSNSNTISMSRLTSGLYILKLETETASLKTTFVKR